jgi:fused signal recognition particle receptor
MEALYTWMLDNGLDPSLLPYGVGALAFILLLVIYFYLRGDTSESSAPDTTLERTAAPDTRPETAPETTATAEPGEAPAAATETAVAEDEPAPRAAEQADTGATEVSTETAPAASVEAPVEPVEEAVAKPAQPAAEAAADEAAREAEVRAAEERAAEQARAAAEAEAQAAEQRAAQEKAAAEQAEAERIAAQKAQDEKAAAERAAAEKAEQEAAELARLEAEKAQAEPAEPQEQPEVRKQRLFERIKSGLSRTKAGLTEQLGNLFLGAKEIDDDLLEEIETLLLMADVGVEATTEIVTRLTDRVERKQLKDPEALREALKEELADLLGGVEHPLVLPSDKTPAVILMVGVNGVGKTTTIGKLAKRYQSEGKSVMLAAGDTFRAAAVEQLQVWGERNNVPVVAQHTGADSASVLFDALQSAKSKGIDVLIADTAGRLQNKDNLMQELQKVVRVMQKIDPSAPHEVMLVLDAGTGQNAISQAKQFKEAVGVTGITLTKLDGTAKGGIIFAIAKQFGLPIRFIGVGEKVDDLRPFEADEFVQALFD